MADQQPFVLDQLAPAQPRPPRRTRRVALVVAASAALAVVVTAGVFLATGDRRPAAPAPAPQSTAPATLNIIGALTLTLPDFTWDSNTTDALGKVHAAVCNGQGGFNDIQGGAQVVVTNASSATVAVDRLSNGVPTIDGDRATSCVFRFSVAAPAGLGFYGVEVSHRGRLQYSEADVHRGLALTLG